MFAVRGAASSIPGRALPLNIYYNQTYTAQRRHFSQGAQHAEMREYSCQIWRQIRGPSVKRVSDSFSAHEGCDLPHVERGTALSGATGARRHQLTIYVTPSETCSHTCGARERHAIGMAPLIDFVGGFRNCGAMYGREAMSCRPRAPALRVRPHRTLRAFP